MLANDAFQPGPALGAPPSAQEEQTFNVSPIVRLRVGARAVAGRPVAFELPLRGHWWCLPPVAISTARAAGLIHRLADREAEPVQPTQHARADLRTALADAGGEHHAVDAVHARRQP